MKKLIISIVAIGILVGCNKEETTVVKQEERVAEQKQEETFDPAEFLKEAENHDLEWYIASVSKLTPEQAEELEIFKEKYETEQEQIKINKFKSMLDNAKIKEFVNDEGQKNLEYTMINTLGYDVEWFQFSWMEAGGENVSEATDLIKSNQEFKLIVDPSFDATLDEIDLATLKLNSSN